MLTVPALVPALPQPVVPQIHHGNGTQKVFWQDDRVLFVSLHRRDKDFYPQVCVCVCPL